MGQTPSAKSSRILTRNNNSHFTELPWVYISFFVNCRLIFLLNRATPMWFSAHFFRRPSCYNIKKNTHIDLFFNYLKISTCNWQIKPSNENKLWWKSLIKKHNNIIIIIKAYTYRIYRNYIKKKKCILDLTCNQWLLTFKKETKFNFNK